ncbi:MULTISPECIES: hypothetical protein [unclassified Sutcliffiella]|uniref:hypothetical protein n=1 Tax=unclassified Sutcliffiella TaxID=2837532 RepID=UPI0030D41C50
MMTNQNSQKGYALLYVLLTIVLIGLFIPPLINSVLSSSLQYKKTEEIIQHDKLAEMGTIYFEKKVIDILEDWEFPEDWAPDNKEAWNAKSREEKNDNLNQYVLRNVTNKIESNHNSTFLETDGYKIELTNIRVMRATGTINYQISTSLNSEAPRYFTKEMIIPIIDFDLEEN